MNTVIRVWWDRIHQTAGILGVNLTGLVMPHIVMLCSSHPVSDERITHKQAVSLAKMGYKVTVVGRDDGTKSLPEVAGLILTPVQSVAGGLFARLRMLPKLYRAAVEARPDVITCHEPESALVGLFARRRCGAPVLFDIHECFQETLSSRLPRGLRGLVRFLSIVLLKSLGRRCNWLTVVSPPNQAFYQKTRRDDRVTIIHNSPRIELFPPCNHDVDGPVTICHDGYLDHSRGMMQILDSLVLARKQIDVRLLIVGRVDPGCKEAFEKRVAELSLADAIVIPGWKPYEEVGRLESTAQIGLVALQPGGNTFKSLNNKLYNYMSCGQPVIAPMGSATEDMVRQYDCGLLVDTTCPEDIATAIVRLATDPELRKRLGANGRLAVERQLGWHKMEELLADIYGQLLKHR